MTRQTCPVHGETFDAEIEPCHLCYFEEQTELRITENKYDDKQGDDK